MAENSREAELKITADASGVRAGLDQAEKALKDFADEANKQGKRAGDGIDIPGEQAKKSSDKVEREVGRMAQAIQRATAATEAGGRSNAAYFEALSKQRGTSDALKPYIDDLKRAEAAQNAARASLGTIGVSAGQTAAALRQVPAQFTDIVTSLQAGQAPLTVFLQQGGQLKDSFGGAGAAARALGGYVLGLVNPFTVAAAAAGLLGLAYFKGAEEAQAFQKTLILTGNVAGVTAQQLSGISASIAGSGVTQGAAAEALNLLASSGKVGAESLGRFAAAAVQLQRVGGPAVEETAKAFAELGNDPLKASIKLDESTNFLTASVYKQIKALEEQGRAVEAAKVAQEAYAAAIEDRFPKLEKNLGSLERLWLNIKDATSAAASAAKAIGRDDTIDSLEAKIAQAQRRRDILATGGAADKSRAELLTEELRIMEQQLATLKAQEGPARVRAAAAAQEAKDKAALQEFDKQSLQYLSKSAQLERDLTAARNQYQGLVERGLISVQQYRDVLAGIRDKARDKSADNAAQRALEQEAALLEKLSGLSGNYQQNLNQLQNARKRNVITEEQYVEKVKELIAQQPFAVKLAKEQADAEKQVADAMKRGEELYTRKIEGLNQSADAVGKQVQKLRDEEQALGVSAALNISLAQAIELVTIKRLEEQQARAAATNDKATADAIQREIDARKELATLIGSKDARDASKKAADEAARDWQRVSDQIGQGLTDSLFRAFEAGKGFFDTLWKGIVNTFKTTTLKLIIQGPDGKSGIVGSLLSSIGVPGFGGLSGGSAAGGGGGLGGLGSLFGLGGAGSLGGAFSSAFSGGTALGGDAIGAGFTALFNGSGTLAGNFGQILGGANGALSGIGGLGGALGYGTALYNLSQGKYGSAAGTALGTVVGGPIGAAIGGAIGGAIDKAFGSVGANQSGASYLSNGVTGQAVNNGMFGLDRAWGDSIGKYFSQGVQDALKASTTTGASLLNAISTAFGGQGGYQVGAFFASDNTRASQGNRSVLGPNGQILSSFSGSGLDKDPTKGLQQLTTALAGDVRSALQQIDIPSWAKSQLQMLTGDVSFEQLAGVVQNILATKDAFLSLGQVMPQLKNLTDSAIEGLLKSFDGLDNLKAAAGSYYENFYSDAEKSARATQQLTEQLAALGVTMPATRDAYRSLVEAQDLNTESGRAAYAQLLKLAPAFAALVPAVQSVGDAAGQTAADIAAAAAKMAEAGRRVLADLAAQQGDLQVELLRAQGRVQEAAALERQQALAKLTEGLSAQDAAAATAAYDLVQSLRLQIDATNQAKTAAEQAAQAAQAAAQAEAQRIAAIAGERDGLITRLLQAQGDTAALRERELAGLDESNRELLRRIFAIEDEKAAQAAAAQAQQASAQAAQQAAQAAEQLRQAWQSTADSIFSEVARIRNLITGGSPLSLANAQSQFAITTAQARAGDQEAAKLLPGLSQTLLQLAEANAGSLLDLQRIRAQIAASLEQTGVGLASRYGLTLPKFATGTNYVPRDMAAIVHEGEAIVPRAYNPAAAGGAGPVGSSALLNEVAGLREDNRAQALAIVKLQTEIARLLKTWDGNGLPEQRATT